MKINVARYSEDPSCATPSGLRVKMLYDLMPQVEKMRLQRNECLVATYIKAAVTKGGIIIPGATQEEDRWQGKVGLLLACGPAAFDYEEVRARAEIERNVAAAHCEPIGEYEATSRACGYLGIPRIGDWCVYRTSATHEIGIAVGDSEHTLVSARFIDDENIKMVITDPTIIY